VVQYARDSNNGLVTDHNKNFPGTLVNSRDKKIRMAFFGDLMIDRNVKTKIDKYGMDYLFEKVASSSVWQDISDSDLIMANLEGAVTDDGQHYRPEMSYDFAFAPDRIKQLADYGFDAFNIANNHLADQGENGIMETDENLEKLGIFYFGCADQQVGECSVKVKEIDGKKIGWAGFSMVYGTLDEERLLARIINLASSTDLVIVNMHWGVEYDHSFNKVQQDLAQKIIDAGADVIIGHHPHVVQGMEIYQGRPIFYSLGNFVFDQYFSADTQEGLGVRMVMADGVLSFSLLPFKSRLTQIEFMEKEEKAQFFKKFLGWSGLKQNNDILVDGTLEIKL